ncbi:hypothetical protein GS539_21365 [Rhodococcus hoagii]|nr:hypothetical protein [Prescottella equi]
MTSGKSHRRGWARLIGTVIDFRLRLAFTTASLVPPTAQRGHAALTRRLPMPRRCSPA